MRKKRAIILSGSTTALLAAYVSWCSRSIYLHVPVPEMTELPPEYREAAKEAIHENGMTRPVRFTWEDLWSRLMHPYGPLYEYGVTVDRLFSIHRTYYDVGRQHPSMGSYWPGERGVSFVREEFPTTIWKVEVYEVHAPAGPPLSSNPLERRPVQ